jgi:hypothetical protein
MKKILVLSILTTLLVSCSSDWNSSVNSRRIDDLELQLAESKNATSSGMIVFEKRTKCASLIPDIDSKLIALWKEYPKLGKLSLGWVFYSESKDACLWIQLTSTYASDGSPLERKALYQYGDDLPASTPLIWCEKILTDKLWANTCEKWDIELARLKWDTNETQLK